MSALYNINNNVVTVPPYIERDGVELFPEVVENRTAILSCPASGLPSPTVRWLRNGEVLPPQLGRLEVIAGGRQLKITSVSLTDAGTYTCDASNKAGKDSQDYRLSVHSKWARAQGQYVGQGAGSVCAVSMPGCRLSVHSKWA